MVWGPCAVKLLRGRGLEQYEHGQDEDGRSSGSAICAPQACAADPQPQAQAQTQEQLHSQTQRQEQASRLHGGGEGERDREREVDSELERETAWAPESATGGTSSCVSTGFRTPVEYVMHSSGVSHRPDGEWDNERESESELDR